jgi:branched-chain amino acid transport system substrate-binding protein
MPMGSRRGWFAAALSLALVACGGTTEGGGSNGSPIEIPVITALDGPAAFLGKGQADAYRVLQGVVNAEGGINGRPVHFNVQDDQSQPAVAVQLASKLASSKAPIFLGPELVALCKATAPLVASGPVDYCLSPGIHPAAGSYQFSTSVSTDSMAQALLSYFRRQGRSRIALLTSTDTTGQDAENAVTSALKLPENQSLSLVRDEHFTTTDVSVVAQISRIKAADPQALIAWSTGTPIATVFKAVAETGLDVPVGTTNGNQTYAQMQAYASFLPRELLIPTAEWPAYSTLPAGSVKDALKTYFDAFRKAGIKPDLSQSLAWDPGMIAVSALRKLGPGATAAQIRGYIAGLRGFAGINGVYDFHASPQRGLGVEQTVVTRWDPAKQTWVTA